MRLREHEAAEALGTVTVAELRVWVAEGLVAPAEGAEGPVFDEVDLARLRLVCELRDACGLDAEAIPVVLSLIDQVHGLRRELRALSRAVEMQPDEVRAEVVRAYRAVAREGGDH